MLCVPQQEEHSMAQPHVARKNCSVALAYIGFWKVLGMVVLIDTWEGSEHIKKLVEIVNHAFMTNQAQI